MSTIPLKRQHPVESVPPGFAAFALGDVCSEHKINRMGNRLRHERHDIASAANTTHGPSVQRTSDRLVDELLRLRAARIVRAGPADAQPFHSLKRVQHAVAIQKKADAPAP